MKKLHTKHRLVPLETLYPNRPPRESPKKPTPFVKPGVSAKIPERTEDHPSIRYLQASTILKDIKSLEEPLREIEDDTKFITRSMESALQVPRAIEMTFNRIHGRLYDIQREIEFSSTGLDECAIKIQQNFRAFSEKGRYQRIQNALRNTIQRDCSMIHECLLGFLLSYSRVEDDLQTISNRRFMVKNRGALKYWRKWALARKEDEDSRKAKIGELRERWLNRGCRRFLRKWKELSYSQHSRKAVKAMHEEINAEAQRRVAAYGKDGFAEGVSVMDLLDKERANLIIDRGRDNYRYHMKNLSLRMWRKYVVQCKYASRSVNALAREFWTRRMKKTYFSAWFSLSVGRVVVFGGYSQWERPENKLKKMYIANFQLQKGVLDAWKEVCATRKRVAAFSEKRQRMFLKRCLRELQNALSEQREEYENRLEGYLVLTRRRAHRVFTAWHHYTAQEKVRRCPVKFILNRSVLMRKHMMIKSCFRRWSVRFMNRQAQRFTTEMKNIEGYTLQWLSAGTEMRESMGLIRQLTDKLNVELDRRKKDLTHSLATVSFMRDEQKSLALAMQNAKFEIERMHSIIGKSSMRYFVDVRPIHGNVVEDVPGALRQYMEQKEQEKLKLAQKAAMPQPVQKQTRNDGRRRKATFAQPPRRKSTSISSGRSTSSQKGSSRTSSRSRKASLQPGAELPPTPPT